MGHVVEAVVKRCTLQPCSGLSDRPLPGGTAHRKTNRQDGPHPGENGQKAIGKTRARQEGQGQPKGGANPEGTHAPPRHTPRAEENPGTREPGKPGRHTPFTGRRCVGCGVALPRGLRRGAAVLAAASAWSLVPPPLGGILYIYIYISIYYPTSHFLVLPGGPFLGAFKLFISMCI